MKRRNTIKSFFFISGIILLYPILSFLAKRKERPPEEITVSKYIYPGEYLLENRFVIFNDENNIICISRKCTHLGCILNYDHSKKMFICPCHKSRFNWDGRFIDGPAKKDLVRFEVALLDEKRGYVVKIPR